MYSRVTPQIVYIVQNNLPPFALDPNGRPVNDYDSIPIMNSFDRFVIGEKFMEINGWIFLIHPAKKGLLVWLKKQIGVWIELDPDMPKFVSGIFDALAERWRPKL